MKNGGVPAEQESGKSLAPRPAFSMTHLTESVPYATSGGETGPGKTGGAPGWQEKFHGEASGKFHGGKIIELFCEALRAVRRSSKEQVRGIPRDAGL